MAVRELEALEELKDFLTDSIDTLSIVRPVPTSKLICDSTELLVRVGDVPGHSMKLLSTFSGKHGLDGSLAHKTTSGFLVLRVSCVEKFNYLKNVYYRLKEKNEKRSILL